MSRWHSYINSAKEILSSYSGAEPFASFLKKHFAQHKKFGGQDRKWVGHLCYCYFRLGKAIPDLQKEERILTGLFLCSREPTPMLAALKPDWNDKADIPFSGKISAFGFSFLTKDIFPWKDQLSSGVDHLAFCESFLIQPDLYLRIRPGFAESVMKKLQAAGIPFLRIDEDIISIPNSSQVDKHIIIDKEAIVQDYSSQRIGEFLIPLKGKVKNMWDCCAASGGKSIMAYDLLKPVDIVVSDIRPSILANLQNRFTTAGIRHYGNFIADLSKSLKSDPGQFDLVIADVPCTGSGTWSRTPEQLYYFSTEEIEKYALRQQKIVEHASAQVRPGGYLLYATCSVFEMENEKQVNFFIEKSGWTLLRQELLSGYDKKADTLFTALFQRPL